METYRNLYEFMELMGSETTEEEAVTFRTYLVERGLLDWDGDHTGGSWSQELENAVERHRDLLVDLMCAALNQPDGLPTIEETIRRYPVGTSVMFLAYDDAVHGVGFRLGDMLTVRGHSDVGGRSC